MWIGNVRNMNNIQGKIDILKAAILPSQDNSFFEILCNCVSILVISGLRLALISEAVVLVSVIPRYVMPFVLHVYGRLFCNMDRVLGGTPMLRIRFCVVYLVI